MKGIITGREEFLYPDSTLGEIGQECSLVMAANGKKGLQILVESDSENIEIQLELQGFDVERYQMKAIPVEYNTGDGVSQGGSMVVDQWEDAMGDYVTRRAPFYVYDCLVPWEKDKMPVVDKKAAVYLCFTPQPGVLGRCEGSLTINDKGKEKKIRINIHVYDVEIPEGKFEISNWFSLEAIRRLHGEKNFWTVLRKYAKAMKRTHQTAFYLELDRKCVADEEKKEFDFEYLTRIIQIFKEEGIPMLEIGPVLSRGFLEDGTPDMYTEEFRCSMFPDIAFTSQEGMEITENFVQTLASYLKKYGWDKKVLLHIHDEPDIHYKNDIALNKRIEQYGIAVNIVKKHIPEAQIIEAVGTTTFKDKIDVLVPVTSSYERDKTEFERCQKNGKKVWNYVCCGPEGKWLNRFLDFAVLKGRVLFWGFAKYGITGFLHWGFNQFPVQMDPFVGTSCYNPTGIGTNFPCGDAFIVYPGKDEPWLGMRLEAQRQGAEDVMLLKTLQEKHPEKAEALIGQVFESNTKYMEEPDKFETVYEELLRSLEDLR